MKKDTFLKALMISIACLCFTEIKAQSINLQHLEPANECTGISYHQGHFNWVRKMPNELRVYSMDTLQNISYYVDSALNPNPPIDIDVINCTHVAGGAFIGLCFDWQLHIDSSAIVSGYRGQGCYFLYNFSTQSRLPFYIPLQNVSFVPNWGQNYISPDPSYDNYDFGMISSGDSLFVTFKASAFSMPQPGFIAQFINLNLVDVSPLNDASREFHAINVFVNGSGKLTHASRAISSGMGTNITIENKDYYQLLQNLPGKFIKAIIPSGTSYSYLSVDFSSATDTIRLANGTNLFSPGFASNVGHNAMLEDHLGRIWVVKDTVCYLYDGAWHTFQLGLNPFVALNDQNWGLNHRFIEYEPNRFMLSVFGDRVPNNMGNGILMFDYQSPNPNQNVVRGNAFFDLNANGILDSGEYPASISIGSGSGQNAFTATNGNYNLWLPDGTFNLAPLGLPVGFSAFPANYALNLSGMNTDSSGFHFALQPDPALQHNLSALLIPVGQNLGAGSSLYIHYNNMGPVSANGDLTLNFSNGLLPVITSPPPVSSTSTSMTWNFSNLGFNNNQIIFTRFNVPSGQFATGDTLHYEVSIHPYTNDFDTLDNSYQIYPILTGPYDPNNKGVYQNGTDASIVYQNATLNYHINFMNLGNDTAYTVIIRDTLNSLLDIGSFELTGSSHPCMVSFHNNVVVFTFYNILLPDSNTNPQGAAGFVSFQINPFPSFSFGQSIPNRAAIVFDFEAPIVTNNAQVNMLLPTMNKWERMEAKQNLSLAPNPAHQFIYLQGIDDAPTEIKIFNAVGEVVLRSIHRKGDPLDVSGLNSGLYLLETKNQKCRFVKK
jgi:hypothetical protein